MQKMDSRRSFQPGGELEFRSSLSRAKSYNDILKRRKEKKTARDWDPRTHEETARNWDLRTHEETARDRDPRTREGKEKSSSQPQGDK